MILIPKQGRLGAALALLAFGAMLHAQRFSFQRYGEAQGLTNQVITDLIQDKQGYIWVATFNGLFRYDGTSFERFGEKQGLITNESVYLLETPSHQLWGISETALFHLEGKYFHKYDLPVHLPNNPQAAIWQQASSSFLLATEKGLATATLRDGKLGSLVFNALGEAAPVRALYSAPDGDVWYSIASGICRSQTAKTNCFGPGEGVPRDSWSAILVDRNRDIWVRSEKQLRVLHRGASSFVDGGSGLPPADGTGTLSADREGNLFVPTQGGLAHMVNGQWKLVTMREGLTSSNTRIALEDREGSLWIGHFGAGLERWRGYGSWEGWTDLEGLDNSSILAINFAPDGDLLLGTDRGLLKFQSGKGTVRTWLEADGLAGDHVSSLAYDQAGNLWVGSSPGGLSYLNPRTGSMRRVYPTPDKPAVSISTLAVDRDGSIWAGTDRGLMRFTQSPHGGFELNLPPGTPSEGNYGLVVDQAGRVWAAGGGKLHVRDGKNWSAIGPPQGLEGDALFLANSEDGSILVLNSATKPYRITAQQGIWHAIPLPALPAPGRLVPYFIGSDSRNAIWVGTDQGVFVLEPQRNSWQWHDEGDGLVWDDTNIGGFHRGRNNDVWIGTSRGLAHYTPPLAEHSNPPPTTLISQLEVNGQMLDPAASITWKYPVTSVQLRVTALTFLNENRTRFLYRRRGIDQSWLASDSRDIIYSDLNPGTYTFDVLAESTDGVMGIEPASVTLTVLPPWFLSRPFIILSVLFAFLLVIAGYRWRIRSYVQRHRELESAVGTRTSELETERALERHQHHVLEMIASGSALTLVFDGISELIHSRHPYLNCSIHPGTPPFEEPAPGFHRRAIHANSSEPVGWLDFSASESGSGQEDLERTLRIAIRLASIAIENTRVQEKLSFQAHHDSLTGLSNRLRFQSSLTRAFEEAKQTGEGFALLYIDLDNFKKINDRYGHRIGDIYLQQVANRFRSCVRKGDMLARHGGDEFAAILFGANKAAAERIMHALHLSLEKQLFIEEFEFHPSASIGYSLYPDSGSDAESLLRAADEAMYAAKLAASAAQRA